MVASRCPPVPARPPVPAAVPPDDRGGAPRVGRGAQRGGLPALQRARRAAGDGRRRDARRRRALRHAHRTPSGRRRRRRPPRRRHARPDRPPWRRRARHPRRPRRRRHPPGQRRAHRRRRGAVRRPRRRRGGAPLTARRAARRRRGAPAPRAHRRRRLRVLRPRLPPRRWRPAGAARADLAGDRLDQHQHAPRRSRLVERRRRHRVVGPAAARGARRRRLGPDRRAVPVGPPLDRGRRGVRRRHRPRCRGPLARPGRRRPAGGHRRRQRRRRVGVHQPDGRARGLDRRAARGGAARPPPRRVGRSGRGVAAVGRRAPRRTSAPWWRDTHAGDVHRLRQMQAEAGGERYDSDDPAWRMGRALGAAAGQDPQMLRHLLDVTGVLARGVDVLARPGVAARAQELAHTAQPLPGPSRAELEDLVGATRLSRSHDGAASPGHRRARPGTHPARGGTPATPVRGR